MQRRTFLKSAGTLCAVAAATPLLPALVADFPVIDTHIHLFDPNRVGSVPWPEKTDPTLYKPALPPRYKKLAQPHGVVGAIAIECSPWLADNFWLRDLVMTDPFILGFIGDLLPEAPDFAATFDQLRRSPLFLGIRYGNLWNRDLGIAVQKPEFVSGLKLLAEAGLVLETANPDPALIAAVIRVSDQVPDLRVVIDHLPQVAVPDISVARTSYEANLHELSRRVHIFVKGSQILQVTNGTASFDVGRYKASLDRLWDLFGEDRIFFGSDWPNSDSIANYDDTFDIAKKYISTRSIGARQKYFSKNSISFYNWKPRTPEQEQLKSLTNGA